MGKLWIKPPDEAMLSAVREALQDMADLEREVAEAENSYTTGARIARADFWGTRGATRKRLAEAEFLTGMGNWKATLQLAVNDYMQGIQQLVDKADHWLLGQYVVLAAVLDESPGAPSQEYRMWWDKASRAAVMALDSSDPREKMWAWSSIVDLQLVKRQYSLSLPSSVGDHLAEAKALDHPLEVVSALDAMVNVVGGVAACEAVWPTYRQFWRWKYWWNRPKWDAEANAGYDYLYRLVKPQLIRMEAGTARDAESRASK